MPPLSQRTGIASGGNWIVDRIKLIDRFPGRGLLANILSESRGTGGAPPNVLMDLALLGASFPLTGFGVVGRDADGILLMDACRQLSIDVSSLQILNYVATSYTDVMTEAATGDRSFYHNRGANALFTPELVPVPQLTCRIFHLGYLLLLDAMDQPDPETGTVAAGLLRALQAAGIKTSLDVVSEDSDRFRTLVPPALRHVDYLILNEIEVGRIVGLVVRRPDGTLDAAALVEAVDRIYSFGPMELVAVHMAEGIYLQTRAGRRWSRGSRCLPPGYIRSAVGAGDAFCAGMLYGLHEGWPIERAGELGIATATASLADSTATGGVGSYDEVLALAARFPERPAPVTM
jgi:sugar/nucleoside kinase (ribokinase family)